jgi:hypothetical protein
MTTQRLDAIMARKYQDRDGNEKSAFTRIGTAFTMQNGGYSIVLDAMPAPEAAQNGGLQYRILLMAPKPREDAPRDNGSHADKRPAGGRPAGYSDTTDDEIPFAPEWR